MPQTLDPAVAKLAYAGATLLAAAYGMAFLEPKDPVRLRWLCEQVRGGRAYQAFLAMDCWMCSSPTGRGNPN